MWSRRRSESGSGVVSGPVRGAVEAGWSGGRRGGLGDRGQRWPGRCTWTETGPLMPGRRGGTVLWARRWAGWQVQRLEGKRKHEGDAWRVTGHEAEDVAGERGSLRRKTPSSPRGPRGQIRRVIQTGGVIGP